jgi:hypothetical protein
MRMMCLNCGHQGGMTVTGKTEEHGENPVGVPPDPPQIPYGVNRFAREHWWMNQK